MLVRLLPVYMRQLQNARQPRLEPDRRLAVSTSADPWPSPTLGRQLRIVILGARSTRTRGIRLQGGPLSAFALRKQARAAPYPNAIGLPPGDLWLVERPGFPVRGGRFADDESTKWREATATRRVGQERRRATGVYDPPPTPVRGLAPRRESSAVLAPCTMTVTAGFRTGSTVVASPTGWNRSRCTPTSPTAMSPLSRRAPCSSWRRRTARGGPTCRTRAASPASSAASTATRSLSVLRRQRDVPIARKHRGQ